MPSLTDDERARIRDLGDEFNEKAGKLIAQCLAGVPEHLTSDMLAHLHYNFSVIAAPYEDHLRRIRNGQEGAS